MKVLFATNHFYPPQSAGGSESSTHDLCISLSKHDLECGVLADLKPSGLTYYINRLKSKLTGSSFPYDRPFSYPIYRGWNPANGAEEVVKAFSPDVAIIQAGQPIPLALALTRTTTPTTIYLRDVEFDKHGGDYKHITGVNFISNSFFTSKSFKNRFGLDSIVIQPIVRREHYAVKSTRKRVLFVCPTKQKGVDIAFSMAEANPDIPFTFLESWHIPSEEKIILKERARKAGNILWVGKRSDMKEVYRHIKLTIIPSIWNEAWGRIATESHINGIPCLASNRGGLPESVGKGGILLEPENNLDEWNYYLRKLWDNNIFYSKYVDHAFEYSKRKEIQPSHLISKLIDFLNSSIRTE